MPFSDYQALLLSILAILSITHGATRAVAGREGIAILWGSMGACALVPMLFFLSPFSHNALEPLARLHALATRIGEDIVLSAMAILSTITAMIVVHALCKSWRFYTRGRDVLAIQALVPVLPCIAAGGWTATTIARALGTS